MVRNIQSHNITLKQEIIEFLDRKLKMLYRRDNKINGINVSFREEKSSTDENKLCEIRLIISGYDLIASTQCKTFEAAISATSEALERQIEKRKTKQLSAK